MIAFIYFQCNSHQSQLRIKVLLPTIIRKKETTYHSSIVEVKTIKLITLTKMVKLK